MEGLTKELLNEVLEDTVISIWHVNKYTNELHYNTTNYPDSSIAINIYELAHKCKEWVYKNGYVIQSGRDVLTESQFIARVMKKSLVQYDGIAQSEPEAIFKACQWIMEQKEK